MNRMEFMTELERLLADMPEEERQAAVQYYADYFADAGEANAEEDSEDASEADVEEDSEDAGDAEAEEDSADAPDADDADTEEKKTEE